MVAAVLALCAAAGAAVTDPLGPYRDRPVVSVDVDAPSGEHVDELRRLIGISPGYLLSSRAVQGALKRLYALGRYSEVALHAERLSGSVALHFSVKRSRHLGALVVEGVRSFDEEALVAAVRAPPGTEIDRRTPELLAQRARAFLARTGFPRAEVTVEERPASGEGAAVLALMVREGEPRRVREVRFGGAPRAGAHVLASLTGVRPGGILDEDELARDRERLQAAYLARGFLRARVAPAIVEGDARSAAVLFEIDAGPRVALHFTGNTVFRDAALRALWPSPSGPMQAGDLDALAQRIAAAYRRAGYPRASAEIHGFHDRRAGVERYVVAVREGPAVAVTSIDFEGARALPAALLRRQVQTVLVRELGPHGALQPLGAAELARAAGEPDRVEPPPIPPEQRWVPELYEGVLEDITAAYRDRGYLRAVVGAARLVEENDRHRVVVPVSEGPETRVRSLAFLGNEALAAGDLYELLHAASARREGVADPSGRLPLPGAPLSAGGVEDARISVVRRYRDEGYLYARVFSDIRVSADGAEAEVAFRCEEGPQVRIENVLIRGNRYTRPGFIHRRMSLHEGGLYRLDEALLDQRNIAALGVFSSVRVRLVDEETPAERKDVVAEVAERNRVAYELWYGLSTAEGPRLRFDYSHLNLAGTASTFAFSLKLNWKVFFGFYGEYADVLADRYQTFSPRQRTEIVARAGIRSARFTTYPVETAARFDLVSERDNALPYSLDAGRAIFGLELLALERLGLTVEPQFSLTSLTCYPFAAGDESGDCAAELLTASPDRRRIDEGLRAEFKLGPSLTLDLRDDPLNPRRGVLASARGVWGKGSTLSAEALASADEGIARRDWAAFSYTKLEASVSGYVPLSGVVLALTARGGTVLGGEVPLDEKFFLGGSTTLRGFQEGALLPDEICVRVPSRRKEGDGCIDASTRDGVFSLPISQGGDHFVLLKGETRLSLSQELVLVVFIDAGNLWLTRPALAGVRLRLNPGFGLRYATPVGPIGVDVGFLPDADPFRREQLVNFQFAVGVF